MGRLLPNPKNNKDEGKYKNSKINHTRRGNDGNGRSHEDAPTGMEEDLLESEKEIEVIADLGIIAMTWTVNRYTIVFFQYSDDKVEKEKTPSSEVLLLIPDKKGSKKLTTYPGLVDSGSFGSLINKAIVALSDFEIKIPRKPTKQDTAGSLINKAIVELADFEIKIERKPKNGILPLECFKQMAKFLSNNIAYLKGILIMK
jgi:hypothetical protein